MTKHVSSNSLALSEAVEALKDAERSPSPATVNFARSQIRHVSDAVRPQLEKKLASILAQAPSYCAVPNHG